MNAILNHKFRIPLLLLTLLPLSPGCLRVHMDPIEVKPITLNVNLKIDRQLDDFFAYEKELTPPGPATMPASAPATNPATGL